MLCWKIVTPPHFVVDFWIECVWVCGKHDPDRCITHMANTWRSSSSIHHFKNRHLNLPPQTEKKRKWKWKCLDESKTAINHIYRKLNRVKWLMTLVLKWATAKRLIEKCSQFTEGERKNTLTKEHPKLELSIFRIARATHNQTMPYQNQVDGIKTLLKHKSSHKEAAEAILNSIANVIFHHVFEMLWGGGDFVLSCSVYASNVGYVLPCLAPRLIEWDRFSFYSGESFV